MGFFISFYLYVLCLLYVCLWLRYTRSLYTTRQICLNGGWYIALTRAALNQINGWWFVVVFWYGRYHLLVFTQNKTPPPLVQPHLVQLSSLRTSFNMAYYKYKYISSYICEKKTLKWLREYHARMSTNNLIRMIEVRRMEMEKALEIDKLFLSKNNTMQLRDSERRREKKETETMTPKARENCIKK